MSDEICINCKHYNQYKTFGTSSYIYYGMGSCYPDGLSCKRACISDDFDECNLKPIRFEKLKSSPTEV